MTPKKPSTPAARKTVSKVTTKATTKATAAATEQAQTVNQASAATAAHSGLFSKNTRVIKKYPNRRLYDTTTSSYITLADIKTLVMKNAPFVVRDAKTDEDLTRSMLLQIILEAEAGGAPMFTEAVLANIIRFYGHAMQGFVGNYLEKNMQTFTDLQNKISEQSQTLGPDAWAKMMSTNNPMMQGVMSNAMEQLQKQTQTMLSMFGLKK